MQNLKTRSMALLLSAASIVSFALPSLAYNHNSRNYYYARVGRHHPVTMHEYFQDHPKVRAVTMGAGVGAAAGAVTGLVANRGIMRGALIGAGTGAGVGLIRSSHIMHRHPIVNDTLTGSAVGLGLGWAAGGHGRNWAGKGLAVGSALGLGAGLLRNGL